MADSLKKVVIFASGTGSNAEKIIDYFSDNERVEIKMVLSNNPKAPVLKMAKKKGVNTFYFSRKALYDSKEVLAKLQKINPDLVVLAGFMWIIPQNIIRAFPKSIINIHPSLLPKYGGKGMYGNHVHRAVLAHQETETGISIHYVNEHYDEGELIAQFKVKLDKEDDLAQLVQKIKHLEHRNYAPVIEKLLAERE